MKLLKTNLEYKILEKAHKSRSILKKTDFSVAAGEFVLLLAKRLRKKYTY